MILLSFDVEEFDLPVEYGRELSFQEQLNVSTSGTLAVLDILKQNDVKATFFITANYAINQPDIVKSIANDGHEIASHGYYHSSFSPEHLQDSRLMLEKLSGKIVQGFRMPRMMPVDDQDLLKAGYTYNSSVNPIWLPGRYNNLHVSRTWFNQNGLLQIPSSVSPILRFPLFWLSFHNLPVHLIKWLSSKTYRKDGYLNIYFHPWEFINLKQEKFGLPIYIARNSGVAFCSRLKNYILWAKNEEMPFNTIAQYFADKLPAATHQ